MKHHNPVVLHTTRQGMETMSVLVTGFEPFANHDKNVSAQVTNAIQSISKSQIDVPQLPRCDLDGSVIAETEISVTIEWDCRILSVDEEGSKKIANEILSAKIPKWDAIIHMGLCESCKEPRLEISAKNILDFRIPDNSGREIKQQPIVANGPKNWLTTVPYNQIPAEEIGIQFSVSNDAGEFLCNETYARTLDAVYSSNMADRLGRKIPTIFLHLPSEEYLDLNEQINLVEKLAAWMVNRPVVTVAAGVMRNSDNHVLSCRRSPDEVFAGEWEFPGGKVETGEDIPACLRRELLEELSVKVGPVRPLCVHRVISGDIELELHTWEVTWDSGEISLSVHDKERWLEINALEQAEWIEADIPMISVVSKKLASQSM